MQMSEPVFKITSHNNLKAIFLYYSKSRKVLQSTYILRAILFTQMVWEQKEPQYETQFRETRYQHRAFLKSVFVPKPAHTHWLPLQS